jgi:hypothetical protein
MRKSRFLRASTCEQSGQHSMNSLRVAAGFAVVMLAHFAGSVNARAQGDPDVALQTDPLASASPDLTSSSSSGESAYSPLTLNEKWLFAVSQTFGPSRLVGYAMHTIFDYAFDLPHQWGRDSNSWGVRVASNFGTSLIRHDLQFAVQALDHEDPRYFRSNLHGGMKRTKYAFIHTFLVRRDNQTWMPAYSLFIADYGMPYLVRQWRPANMHPLTGFEAGSMGLGVAVGSNVFNEFLPDLKKKLPKAFRFGGY